jgi:hypothetical protein
MKARQLPGFHFSKWRKTFEFGLGPCQQSLSTPRSDRMILLMTVIGCSAALTLVAVVGASKRWAS